MTVLGYEPVTYTRKSDGKPASGTRLYVQLDNHDKVFGIATDVIWLKDEVFQDFCAAVGGMDRVLGAEVEVYYNQYKTPVRVMPVSEV